MQKGACSRIKQIPLFFRYLFLVLNTVTFSVNDSAAAHRHKHFRMLNLVSRYFRASKVSKMDIPALTLPPSPQSAGSKVAFSQCVATFSIFSPLSPELC